jgi:C4-dicarboxylate-specific signal transduction histidine kinase
MLQSVAEVHLTTSTATELTSQREANQLHLQRKMLETRLRKRDEQRRAMLHILEDFRQLNERLAKERKALIHILADYEKDRRVLETLTERLQSSRRALLHILQDSHRDRMRLEIGRKAMINIMGDLQTTMAEGRRHERELRDKQDQLVQAGKLATLGELATGIAHELNNPLNNIGLFAGNAIDSLELGEESKGRAVGALRDVLQQVRKATEIISHLRTFGRAAPVSRDLVSLRVVIEQAISLVQEQLRLRQIDVTIELGPEDLIVEGNSIQLEQVFINLLTNARDAVADSPRKAIRISGAIHSTDVQVTFTDTGRGIPRELEGRIFDPFFTTKEIGKGTGLGLSIIYGIVREHGGTISVVSRPGEGATFLISLPSAGGAGRHATVISSTLRIRSPRDQ